VYRARARHDGPRAHDAFRRLSTDHDQLPDEPVDLAHLHAALDRVNERYRAVISLRYLGGLSADDAAAELGCSNAVLAVTLHRALGALRREMARATDSGGVR